MTKEVEEDMEDAVLECKITPLSLSHSSLTRSSPLLFSL